MPNWDTKDTLQIIEIVVLGAGLYFAGAQLHETAKSSTEASRSSSAAALGTLMNANADLQWRILEDPTLHVLWEPAANGKGLSPDEKVEILRGMLISHYAFVFDIYQLGQIPDSTWSAMRADMAEFFIRDENQKRWTSVKNLYHGNFREFVDNELLNRPK